MPSSSDPVTLTCEKCQKAYTIKTFTAKERARNGTPSLCPECMTSYRVENMKKTLSNKSPDEKAASSAKKSESVTRAWKNASDEDRQRRAEATKKHIKSLGPDEMKVRMSAISAGNKKYWANLPESERKALRDKRVKNLSAHNAKMTTNDEYRKVVSDRISEAQKEVWSTLGQSDRGEKMKAIRDGHDKWQSQLTDEEKQRLADKAKATWGKKSPDEKKRYSERMHEVSIDAWSRLTPEEREIRIKHILQAAGSGSNQLHKKFEEYFSKSYISRTFRYVPEYLSSNDGSHHWDYAIYDSNTLVMLVDLDGAYFHADICDYSGIRSHEEYDEARFLSVPHGVKYHIIYEHEFSKSFDQMIKLLMVDYSGFINEQLAICKRTDFPYPHYTDKELIHSWSQLCKLDTNDPDLTLSTRNREGDRLITHFHPSIYHAHVRGKPSPYNAWHDEDMLRKCIENRIIYANILNPNKILQGFNVSKIAPKVSVFSAGRAKLLIDTYLSEFDTIFDPFSGFGGRMLGALSLDKKYIGQDIASRYIEENQRIAEFIGKKDDVRLVERDILSTVGEFPCLFTCPPYSDKETWVTDTDTRSCDDWILECLRRYRCRKYLFVIDKTTKFSKYIVDTSHNKSHFGRNSEYVVMICDERRA